jgi:hypothetical protein
MSAFRYGIAAAAISSGILVVQAGANSPGNRLEEPQQATTPMAVPPVSPTTSSPPTIFNQQLHGQRAGFEAMGLRGFSVSLVIGDLTGAATADNLPAGAKKALSDMRDFLPYKSYRLLDTHWILCCSGVPATVAGRLRGAEEDDYTFTVSVRPAGSSWDQGELGITFSLRDAGGSADQAQAVSNGVVVSANDRLRRMSELIRERDDLERRYAEGNRKYGDQHPNQVSLRSQLENSRRRIQELERMAQTATRTTSRGRDLRPVLESTFSMKVGETVVIGASSLKGQKALITLLTAASRKSPVPRER